MPVPLAPTSYEDAASVEPFWFDPSINTEDIFIRLANRRLSIPRNYITQLSLCGSELNIEMYNTFPEFAGVTAANIALINSIGQRGSRVEWDTKVVSISRVTGGGKLSQWKAGAARHGKRYALNEARQLISANEGDTPILDVDSALVQADLEYGRGIVGWIDVIEVAPGMLFLCRYGHRVLEHWAQVHESVGQMFENFLAKASE